MDKEAFIKFLEDIPVKSKREKPTIVFHSQSAFDMYAKELSKDVIIVKDFKENQPTHEKRGN